MSHDLLALRTPMAARTTRAPGVSHPIAATAAAATGLGRDSYVSAPRPVTPAADDVALVAALRAQVEALSRRLAAIEATLRPAPVVRPPAATLPVQMPGMAHPTMAGRQDTDSLQAAFTASDADGSGDLDYAEVLAHEVGDEQKATLHFGDADQDRSSRLTQAEWIWHHQNSPLHAEPEEGHGAEPASDAPPDQAP